MRRQVVAETNQFQEMLAGQLRGRAYEAGKMLQVKSLNQTGAKLARIAALESWVAQGNVVLSRRHALMLEQMREFPGGEHDDGPDALEMAVHAAMKVQPLKLRTARTSLG